MGNNLPVSILAFSRELGIKSALLRELVSLNRIVLDEKGYIPSDICEQIRNQRSEYMSAREFLESHDNGLFNSGYSIHRNKFRDYLEVNGYFGIKKHLPKEFLFCMEDENDYYFSKKDIPLLEAECKHFFEDFGLSNAEKLSRLKDGAGDRPKTIKYLALMEKRHFADKDCTPSFVSFAELVLGFPDAGKLDNRNMVEMFKRSENESRSLRSFVKEFCDIVSREEGKLRLTIRKKKERKFAAPAYSREEVERLATIFFYRQYAEEHNLVGKAFEKELYAEMWLFHCSLFTCAWRAEDICRVWSTALENVSKHYDNIEGECCRLLEGKANKETLLEITDYCISTIEKSNPLPSKTGKGKLVLQIRAQLKPFFGQLVLLVLHHHKAGKGDFLKASRYPLYDNRRNCEAFYGKEILQVLGYDNLETKRLNKSFLQGLQESAGEMGNSAFCGHVIAAFARSHMNLDTTSIYLRDGQYSKLDADEIISMMFEAGIMCCVKQNLVISAFPEFGSLPAGNRTEIMRVLSDVSPYQIEARTHVLFSREKNRDSFYEGDMESGKNAIEELRKIRTRGMNDNKEVLCRMDKNFGKVLLGVFNGKGAAKDKGVFCERLALGLECENPTYESCLANICPNCILTKTCLEPILDVIRYYRQQANDPALDESFSKKYASALRNVIFPAFKPYLQEIMKMMESDREKEVFKNQIRQILLEDRRDARDTE